MDGWVCKVVTRSLGVHMYQYQSRVKRGQGTVSVKCEVSTTVLIAKNWLPKKGFLVSPLTSHPYCVHICKLVDVFAVPLQLIPSLLLYCWFTFISTTCISGQ